MIPTHDALVAPQVQDLNRMDKKGIEGVLRFLFVSSRLVDPQRFGLQVQTVGSRSMSH